MWSHLLSRGEQSDARTFRNKRLLNNFPGSYFLLMILTHARRPISGFEVKILHHEGADTTL